LLPVLGLLPLLAGCADESPSEVGAASEPVAAISTYDPIRCGTISGRVTWSGPIPTPPPFLYGAPKPDGHFDIREVPNPNRPIVDPGSRAVSGAVVFLRGVDTTAAKPWDMPAVRVEMKDRDIGLVQGDRRSRVGFVRRGEVVSFASAEPVFHVLRARGASFFSIPFPDPGKESSRRLDTAGRVELSSGSGFYWATASLFVDDHPYYTITDRDGRFFLTQVPSGSVEVVAWLPGWTVARQERDPESGLITRQTYGPPVEVVRSIRVAPGQTTDVLTTLP
jgi:hypothetical protein